MCGIVGYISNTDKLYEGPKDHFMRYALALDTLRGEDSTGLITVRKRFKVSTNHSLLPGDVFVHSTEYERKVNLGWAQIGHNRAATRGETSLANAHPFTFGDVTMVHNGTLYADGRSLPTFDAKLKVDSMQIALALSLSPPEKAHEVLEDIDGSFALVWTDKRDESINMARNAERPLHIGLNNRKSIMWYMSDGTHLHSINKSFGAHECKASAIYEIDRLVLLKFKKGQLKPEVIKFDPFVRAVTKKPLAHSPSTTTTNKSTKSGSSSTPKRTAFDRATDKWKMGREDGGTEKTTNGSKRSNVRVSIAGRMRKVPTCMQNALLKELQLCPDDMLQFQPNDAVQMENDRWVVYGTLNHPHWADMAWDTTIIGVKNAQYTAYKECDWLVRPIGICPAHEFDQLNPAILGALVHCDWEGYQTRNESSSDDDKEEDSVGEVLVMGPGGSLIYLRRFQTMLEHGCINCGMDLEGLCMKDCLEANNGQDMLCPTCVKDLQGYCDGTVH